MWQGVWQCILLSTDMDVYTAMELHSLDKWGVPGKAQDLFSEAQMTSHSIMKLATLQLDLLLEDK